MADAAPSVRDKVVLLTGATGRMGRILIETFLDSGARLALCVRRMANLPELEARLADRGESPMILPCDLRYEENVVRMIHRVVNRFGRIDAILNVAAIHGPKLPVIDYPAEPWRDVFATNVYGVYLVCREALPWMVRQGGGSIINVTSSLTTQVKTGAGAYLVSNHAIEGLTKLLAAELKGTNVRVNCVNVGTMSQDLKPSGPEAAWTHPFLRLVSDETAGLTGERVTPADFA